MSDRMTISMPEGYAAEIDAIQKELKIGRSTLLRMAFDAFIREQRRVKLRKRAAQMRDEYRTNSDLTVMKGLEGGDFEAV
jgi:metal-responsive CopG/Arc/MetJ family transcriptional regulator